MTIYGNRSNVAVVRERGGKNYITRIDLRSEEALRSTCYYIEQNDIIIVSPNKYRAATAEINQNRSFWVSLTTTAISVATFLVTLLK
jgi:polysaccharide export outer membrane protein